MQPAALPVIMFIVISIASLITISCVAIIALGSSGVFTSSKSSATTKTTISSTTSSMTTTISSTTFSMTTTISSTTSSMTTTIPSTTAASTVSVSSLNDISVYPNGSYSAELSSFSSASNTLALVPMSQSALDELGVVDNSSTIIEAGRTQYLYLQLPNDTSNASNRLMSLKGNADLANSARLMLGSNVITGVALHFGALGNDNSVVIVPISDDNSTNSQLPVGVHLYYLTSGSVIIRIDISVPTSLCPLSNGQVIDACLSIVYQAYTVVNHNQITSALLVDVQMACGDVCSLSSGLCSASCVICNNTMVEGYHTPVTRRYNMSSSAGSFQFEYQTYTIQDRITVWNAGILIFDTYCVGAGNTMYLSYSSNSPFIRVDVEPDCACPVSTGCGTVWYFIVHCLNSTAGSRSITNNNKIASDNTIESSLSDKTDIERRLYADRNKFLEN